MRYAETGFDLEIDLTRGNIERVPTDPGESGAFLGGAGAAAEILWDRVPPEVDAFSPRNLLIFSAGLLDGTPVPGANRTSISCIDPQSNLYVHSAFEGSFGPELKQAGYDKIVISGKAPAPVYLWINNDRVELRDAGHLAGKSALETAALIQKELKNPYVRVAAIGPAGENRVCQASIDHANTSASRGAGVVMGDKGLKAIAVRGTKDLAVAKPAELFELCNRQYREIYDNPHCGDVFLSETDDCRQTRSVPWSRSGKVRGFRTEELQREWAVTVEREEIHYQWENYSQEMEEHLETVVEKSRLLRGTGCYNCTRECHQAVSLPGDRKYFLKSYVKLAYVMASCEGLRFNFEVLARMQELGLDELAAAQAAAFAMKLHGEGILTDADLPGFPEDPVERFIYLVEKIALREGIGGLLADGLPKAARTIGKGAEALVGAVKGIEQLPLRLSRPSYPHFLMLATGDRTDITQIEGSFPQQPISDRTERNRFVRQWEAAPEPIKKWFSGWTKGKPLPPEAAVAATDWNELMHYADDSLGICPLLSSFRGQYGGKPPYHLYNLPNYICLATGLEYDAEKLLDAARRARQLVRAINVRRGMTCNDERVAADLWEGRDAELEEKHLDAYYACKGWNPDGVPTAEALGKLGLARVAEELAARGLLDGK